MNLTLGQAVRASDTLVRRTFHEKRESEWSPGFAREVRRKEWIRHGEHPHRFLGSGTAPAKPADGIVVGLRSLDERGTAVWMGEEEGYSWSGDRGARRQAVLIATSLYRTPVLAWLEDVTAESADQVHGDRSET